MMELQTDRYIILNGTNLTTLNGYSTAWDDEMWKLVVQDFRESQFTLSDTTTIVLIVLYVPIFITALIGNIIVLLVIIPNERMWSVTNNFLVNLAVADLLVTVLCVPMTVARRVYKLWVYGDLMCKLTPYLQGVSVAASTFTITAMSLDRCLAIRHPMKFRRWRTTKYARILILLDWLASMLLFLPLLFVRHTESNDFIPGEKFTHCLETWSSLTARRVYDISLLLIVCVIPAQIVFVSYALMGKRLWVTDKRLQDSPDKKTALNGSTSDRRSGMENARASRRRVAIMCITVSVVFVVCWTPYYVMNVYLDFRGDTGAADDGTYFTLLIGHMHSITNPILYCFLHKTFRHCVLKYLPCVDGNKAGQGMFTQYRTSMMMRSLKSSKREYDRESLRSKPSTGSRSSQKTNKQQTEQCDSPVISEGARSVSPLLKDNNNSSRWVQLKYSRCTDSSREGKQYRIVEIEDTIKEEGRTSCLSVDSKSDI